jgi:hypothetical protein
VATKIGVTFFHIAKRCRCFYKKFKDKKNIFNEMATSNSVFRAIVTIFNNRQLRKINQCCQQFHFISWPTSSSFRCAPYGRNIMPIFIVEIDSTNLKKSFGN